MIAACGLTRRFGSRVVVNDVTFAVQRGEIVALVGPNGAGKTTTLRMLAGLVAPTTGTVVIDGVRLTRETGSALRRRIGFLTEAPGLWDRLTVRENLRVYAGLYGLADTERTIDRALEVFELADRSSARTAELSKGTRQKVALARALLHDPGVLLLDEPTSGLDPEIRRTVRRLLEERRAAGCAILVSTHNLDEAERLADRVAVLHERLLALDRPSVLRRRLTRGRLMVRVAGNPSAFVETARAAIGAASPDGAAADVAVEGAALMLCVSDPERQTPALVSALVSAGARILEIRVETPALEDVYLHLVEAADRARRVGGVEGGGG